VAVKHNLFMDRFPVLGYNGAGNVLVPWKAFFIAGDWKSMQVLIP